MDVKVTEIREVNFERANELFKDGDWIVLGCKANNTSDTVPLYIQPQDITASFIYSLGKLEPRVATFL